MGFPVVHWLNSAPAMQGIPVQSQVPKIPYATKLDLGTTCWAHAPEPTSHNYFSRVLQPLEPVSMTKPPQQEVRAPQKVASVHNWKTHVQQQRPTIIKT